MPPLPIAPSKPWNNWYHITQHVYASWLPGDPRGFRSRHHRDHIDGDYKTPPPKDKYTSLHTHAQNSLSRSPIKLDPTLHQFIATSFAEKLRTDGIQVLVIAVDSLHVHILARFPDQNPRYWIGWAKKHVSQQLKAHGLAVGMNLKEGEGLWSKSSHSTPIKDRPHQLQVFKYILAHANKGAKIWRFDDPH